MKSKEFISSIISEVGYRCKDGIVDFTKKSQQSLLSEILYERGFPELVQPTLDFLIEDKDDNNYIHVGGSAYVRKADFDKSANTGKEGAKHYKKDDNDNYTPMSTSEYEQEKASQGEAGGATNNTTAQSNPIVSNVNSESDQTKSDAEENVKKTFSDPMYQKKIKDEADTLKRVEGGSSEKVDITKFKSEREDILSGKKTQPGTGGSTIGELYGIISVESIYKHNTSEDDFLQNNFDDIKYSAISKGLTDNDIIKWMKIAYKTGQSELNELESNSIYNFKSPQSSPYPIGIMDPVNNRNNTKQTLINFFKNKVATAVQNGDSSKEKFYTRQLKFIKLREDTDTGILYETNDNTIGFKHTSNKKSFSAPVFNSTINKRGAVMQLAAKSVARDYNMTEGDAKQIVDNLSKITKGAAKIVETAGSISGQAVRDNIDNPIEYSEKHNLGELFKNFDGGQKRRKNYMVDLKKSIKLDSAIGVKINRYFRENNIQPPYTDNVIAGVVFGLAKDGDNTNSVKKYIIKVSDDVKLVRAVYNRMRRDNIELENLKLKELTLKTVNGYKNIGAQPFSIESLNTMLSPDMNWIEKVGATTRDSMSVAHTQLITDLTRHDNTWENAYIYPSTKMNQNTLNTDTYNESIDTFLSSDMKLNEKTNSIPMTHTKFGTHPNQNGPYMQTYIESYMKQMHWDRYIYKNEDDIGDMNIAGYTVNSKTMRDSLAALSHFNGTVVTDDDKKLLFNHLRKTLKVSADTATLLFDTTNAEIGREKYRTKGVGQNAVIGAFGNDLQKMLKSKVL